MWRNSVYFAQFMPGVDGRVAVALFIFLMHMAWWTFFLFILTSIFFWAIERRGYTMGTAWLRMKRMLTGNMRQKWGATEYSVRRLPNDMENP